MPIYSIVCDWHHGAVVPIFTCIANADQIQSLYTPRIGLNTLNVGVVILNTRTGMVLMGLETLAPRTDLDKLATLIVRKFIFSVKTVFIPST